LIPEAWNEFFGNDDVPKVLATQCCSQFAVSKERVMAKRLHEYERMRMWLMTRKADNELSGQVMEYLWHVIFGMEPVYCPDVYTCRCNVYGECRGTSRRLLS
jgi:hypothetical protein